MDKELNYSEKIENFKLLIENQDDEIAINYLQKVVWAISPRLLFKMMK